MRVPHFPVAQRWHSRRYHNKQYSGFSAAGESRGKTTLPRRSCRQGRRPQEQLTRRTHDTFDNTMYEGTLCLGHYYKRSRRRLNSTNRILWNTTRTPVDLILRSDAAGCWHVRSHATEVLRHTVCRFKAVQSTGCHTIRTAEHSTNMRQTADYGRSYQRVRLA